MITRSIGFLFLPAVIKFSPLALIILSPFLHHLILTSTLISAPLFIISGSIISIFQCSIGYLFGEKKGVKGVNWILDQGFISEHKVDQLQKAIRFSAPLVLLLIPGPLVAMISGASKLNPKIFFYCMIPSQILWICACYILGVKLENVLNQINGWLIEHWISLSILILVIKLLHTIYQRFTTKNQTY